MGRMPNFKAKFPVLLTNPSDIHKRHPGCEKMKIKIDGNIFSEQGGRERNIPGDEMSEGNGQEEILQSV